MEDAISKCLYHFLWCGHQMVPYQKTEYLPYFASSQTHHLFPEQSRTLIGRNYNQGLQNNKDWLFNKYHFLSGSSYVAFITNDPKKTFLQIGLKSINKILIKCLNNISGGGGGREGEGGGGGVGAFLPKC